MKWKTYQLNQLLTKVPTQKKNHKASIADYDTDSPVDANGKPIVKKIKLKSLPYGKEIQKTKVGLEDWLTITSSDYAKLKKFPTVEGSDVHLTTNYTRINDKFINGTTSTKDIPGQNFLWFRQNLKYIYYFDSKDSYNALGSIYLDNVADARDIISSKDCFTIFMKEDVTYKLCAQDTQVKNNWLCFLQILLKVQVSEICGAKYKDMGYKPKPYKIQTVVQPMILIPLAAKHCNEEWNYNKVGADWDCKCSQHDGGDLQSPINLPPPIKSIDTPISPIFAYETVLRVAENNSLNGLIKEGEYQKIFFKDGALRIYANNFGKIVTLDGTGYYAEEINFHTPSEHLINGKRFDMEMKVIHRARTVGDYGKTLTLSFMFQGKAGAYNKFLDKLDFYNLPNPYEKVQEILEDIFIPNIFLDEDIEGSIDMAPFSFFSYEGSITEPPCNEKTIVYVASDPIFVSLSTVQLFREALSMPDQVDPDGKIISSTQDLTNYRLIQPLKGRAIFHYNKNNDCPLFKRHVTDVKEKGHYERIKKNASQYFYVGGNKPSGIPNAFVVSDSEGKGHLD